MMYGLSYQVDRHQHTLRPSTQRAAIHAAHVAALRQPRPRRAFRPASWLRPVRVLRPAR